MNWLAIIVAVIASMILGAIWYSPFAFGKRWLELSGRTTMGQGSTGPLYGLTAVGALIQAIALSWLIPVTRINTGAGGAVLGLLIGLGFLAPPLFSDALFSGRNPRLLAIIWGFAVVNLIVQGAIIAFWP